MRGIGVTSGSINWPACAEKNRITVRLRKRSQYPRDRGNITLIGEILGENEMPSSGIMRLLYSGSIGSTKWMWI